MYLRFQGLESPRKGALFFFVLMISKIENLGVFEPVQHKQPVKAAPGRSPVEKVRGVFSA
jgi:hypothetical protein